MGDGILYVSPESMTNSHHWKNGTLEAASHLVFVYEQDANCVSRACGSDLFEANTGAFYLSDLFCIFFL